VTVPVPQRVLLVCLFLLLSFVGLSGCAGMRLVSDYDEATDKGLTAIQQKTDDFIDLLVRKAGTADASLAKQQEFYDEMDRLFRRLEFRVASIPGNDHTIDLVKKARLVILGEGKCSEEGVSLKDLHCLPENRDKGPSATVLEISRRNINQALTAALSLELAKKLGRAQNK
jgi:hypothetical protein